VDDSLSLPRRLRWFAIALVVLSAVVVLVAGASTLVPRLVGQLSHLTSALPR